MKKKLRMFFKNKTNLLFIILVLSAFILPVTYSRYITRDYGSTTSYLAKWQIDMVGSSDTLNLVALNVSEATYNFSITSISDVACDYSLKLMDVPKGITLKIDDDSTIYTPDNNGTIIVNNFGGFDVNDIDTTHNHVLKFITTSECVSEEYELNLDVVVKQRMREA